MGHIVSKVRVKLIASFLLLSVASVLAVPPRLVVHPHGTNQLELSASSLQTNVNYLVMVRTNCPDGYWIRLTGILGSTNTTATVIYGLDEAKQWPGLKGLTLQSLANWTFVVGSGEDSDRNELPDVYEELALRSDPYSGADPYGDPDRDGWSNLQEMQNNTDPLRFDQPPAPTNVDVRRYTNGLVKLSWSYWGGSPDYFTIERAQRTLRPGTNVGPFMLQPPSPLNKTNFAEYMARQREVQRRFGQPFSRRHDAVYVTGPYQAVARVLSKPGQHDYTYTETNVIRSLLDDVVYRVQAHHVVPPRAYLDRVNTTAISETILPVTARPATNGYELTVTHPIPYGWYLLLVRDRNNPQWRASGYFTAGANRNPVQLHVDAKGMMAGGQSPIAMPEVHYLPDVGAPEFVAGWGEDSDGDGLPDIYEVLVTHTKPDSADTGNTGVLDGYKEMTGDGWSNLEKFRRRVDPSKPAHPPATVELKEPTGLEIMQALTPKTDLSCEPQIEVRTNGASTFQPIEQLPWMLSKIVSYRQPNEHRNFDMRVSWRFADTKLRQHGPSDSGGAAAYEAVASLMEKIGMQLVEALKANLASNPPLSRREFVSRMTEVEHAYRQGELDKGVAMAEMMLLQDNQSQDFYGKVIDQYGRPVTGAEVSVQVSQMEGRGSSQRTQTDAEGLFQFIGLRGKSLNVVPEKEGYQIEGHGLGTKGLDGPETSPTNRAVYTMWKLKGPEPMIHDRKFYQFKADNRVYTFDLLSKKMVEGTNGSGDLQVQFQRPPQVKPRENFEWSFTMTAIGGGLIEVTNNDYLNEAPARGYIPEFKISMNSTNSNWRGWNGEKTFYLKSRDGKAYGHFHIRLDPVYRDGSSLELDSYVNPSGSRNLEFDPSKQTEYTPKLETNPPVSKPAVNRQ